MRYRRFGSSDLVVSEVGFGTWTLVTDWWGRTDHPHAMITAALDAGINFIDTAPVYGTEGAGESILAPYLTVRDDIVITTKCGYDIKAERRFPGQSERPADWRPESIRQQCEDSLRRLGTDRIDLYQLHNPRIEPILADDLWEALLELKHEGKVRELGVALGPAIGWVEEGNRSIDDRPIVSLQTVFNALEQEPGRTFAARPRVQIGRRVADLARAARLRLALGQGEPRHGVPEGRSPRAPQPRQHARQLREGGSALVPLVGRDRSHDRAGRDRGDPREPGVHVRAADRAVGRRRDASTRPRPKFRSPPTSTPRSTRSVAATSTTSTVTSCR